RWVNCRRISERGGGKGARREALVGGEDQQQGLVRADRVIWMAGASGLIAELDVGVMRRACEDLAQLNRHGYGDLKVTVNCSALTLGREELATEVEMALFQAGLAPRQLELEVTENALMGDIHHTISLLKHIRAQGVALSIDDFGTGYSSLAYLKRLPLDVLKIDRSFIQDVPGSQKDREIVQAIIIMAHTLHLKVVTEGVETVEQHEFLASHGCDYLQGYLLSRPVPLAELRPILERLGRQPGELNPCCDTALPGSPDLFADNPGYRAGASVARRGH
ncbi:EAL domain-containing protein, partial [Pseudomonas soli]|uniref:EAL domain-containing protein n=1 Tax=Pseudomonas soli TaxID=1306993 RepID=UPI00299E2214